jgi:DNA polymerase III subunit epsilon
VTALVIVDTETSGVDAKRDALLEVAAVLYDTKSAAIVLCESMLVHAESNAAAAINGIPEALLRESWCGQRIEAVELLRGMMQVAEGVDPHPYFVAHNAAFDRQWLGELGEDGQPWICSYEDASWPRVPGETGNLTSIALAYGVGVVRAHRAIEDCLTLAAVLTRVHEIEGGLDAWLARALEPKREIVALVSYERNQLAKNAGFRWNPDRKVWAKRIRESQVDAFVSSLPFKTRAA